MKRWLVALLAGSAIFAGVYGFADSLNLTSDSLGAGSSAVSACQSGALNVSYTPTFASGGYEATTVTVNNIDATAPKCGNNKAIKVTLTGSGSAASDPEQTGTIATGANPSTKSFTFSGIKAADVTGAHVVISGS